MARRLIVDTGVSSASERGAKSFDDIVFADDDLWLPPSRPVAVPVPLVFPKTQDIHHDSSVFGVLGPSGGECPAFSEAVAVHPGMSGQVLLRDALRPDDRLLRIRLQWGSLARGGLRVDFVDQRIVGSMTVDQCAADEEFAADVRAARPAARAYPRASSREPTVAHQYAVPRDAARFAQAHRSAGLQFLLESGVIKPVIDRSFALSEIPDAQRYLEAGHARGRVAIAI